MALQHAQQGPLRVMSNQAVVQATRVCLNRPDTPALGVKGRPHSRGTASNDIAYVTLRYVTETLRYVMSQGRRDRGDAAAKIVEKSHFHGKAEKDPVTGRSWLEPPKDLSKTGTEYCYLPKKWVHTWSGHTKGVNAIRQAPSSCPWSL